MATDPLPTPLRNNMITSESSDPPPLGKGHGRALLLPLPRALALRQIRVIWSYQYLLSDTPGIEKKPPAISTTKEGSHVSLPCYPKGYPKPEITWYKDGRKIDSRLYKKETGVLTFPSIQFSDRGLYKCEARNFLGFESATVKVVIEG